MFSKKTIHLIKEKGKDPDDSSRKLVDLKITYKGDSVAKVFGASYSDDDVEYDEMLQENSGGFKHVQVPKHEPYSYSRVKEDTKIEVNTTLEEVGGIDFDTFIYNNIKDGKNLFHIQMGIEQFLDKLKMEAQSFFDLEEDTPPFYD